MSGRPEPSQPSNSLVLIASLAEAKPLRYTPSGIPAVDLELQHGSEQPSLEAKRKVALIIKAVAFGALAERLVRQSIGSEWVFAGFLASARSQPVPSRQLIFHIQDFQPVPNLS